jgi:DNA-binding transcriptional MerR regulator
MRIGELSERTGVSRRSLRYWERQGLLQSLRHGNGYREYDADAAEAVGRIRALLDIGLPTAVIRQLLPCTGDAGPQPDACPGLLAWVAEIRDDLDRKVEQLAANRDAITRYLRTASSATQVSSDKVPAAH